MGHCSAAANAVEPAVAAALTSSGLLQASILFQAVTMGMWSTPNSVRTCSAGMGWGC